MTRSTAKKHPIEILLVEDSLSDIELFKEAFEGTNSAPNIHTARDGDEALDYLYKRGKHEKAVRPDLILLDLNIPKKSGKEVLSIIKDDQYLKHIPAIVLTGSDAETDVADSYQLQANAYIVKPSDLPQFLTVVQTLENFWFTVAKLLQNKMD